MERRGNIDDDLDFSKPVEELPGDEVSVDLDAALEDDGDDEQEERQWRRKKRQRLDTIVQDRTRELESQLENERQERARLAQQVQSLQNFANQYEDDEEDPFETKAATLTEERNQLLKTWNSLPPKAQAEQMADFEAKLLANEHARVELAVDKRLAKNKPAPVNSHLEYQKAVLMDEFGDVFKNPQALRHADGYWMQETAAGAQDTLDLKREAFQRARERFRTGGAKRGKPTDATKAKFVGESRGGGSTAEPSRVVLSKQQRGMADARWPELPEAKRYAKMAAILKAKGIR